MTAPGRLTAAERALLTAILGVIDLPHGAEYGDIEGRDQTLRSRAAELSGCLQEAASSDYSLDSVITIARSIAARPLKYTPETPEQVAEREAAFRARYSKLFPAEPSLAEILPGALAEIEAIGRNPEQPS
jgi:hypothetical protein